MDASGVVWSDHVTELKDKLMKLNIAELQHILNYLQHKRDDLLIVYTLPYNWFVMDIAHFRLFKEWLLSNNVFDLEELVKDVMKSPDIELLTRTPLKPLVVQCECPEEEGSNARSCACVRGLECDAPSSGSESDE
jgi:hypothetical protein